MFPTPPRQSPTSRGLERAPPAQECIWRRVRVREFGLGMWVENTKLGRMDLHGGKTRVFCSDRGRDIAQGWGGGSSGAGGGSNRTQDPGQDSPRGMQTAEAPRTNATPELRGGQNAPDWRCATYKADSDPRDHAPLKPRP